MTEVGGRCRVSRLVHRGDLQFENEDMFPPPTPALRADPPESQPSVEPTATPDKKFRGFEVFLEIEDEKDIPVPKSEFRTVANAVSSPSSQMSSTASVT